MKKKQLFAVGLILVTGLAFAEAKIVDINQQDSAPTATGNQDSTSPVPMLPDKTESKPLAQAESNATASTLSSEVANIPPPDVSNLTVEQRIARVEQQINNLTTMNLPARLDALQQENAELRGQHEQDAHDIKALNEQLRAFYADLTRRVGGTSNIKDTTTTKPAANHGSSMDSESSTLSSAPSAMAATDDVDQQSVPKEQKLYEGALNLLQQKKYSTAAEKMDEYLKAYPTGTYVINAHYWLGESHYLLNQFDLAANEFKLLLDKYPNSTKTQDAMLKLAIIHNNKGKKDLARKEFLQVQKRFPGSTAAQIAKQQLANMSPNAIATTPNTN